MNRIQSTVRTTQQTLRLGYKNVQFMFHKGIIAVCSKIRTKFIYANCGQSVEFSDV